MSAIISTPPPAPPSTPIDLSEQLGSWLHQTEELINPFGLASALQEVAQLQQRRRTPGFRLIFVGESTRGKSTLINRLLDRDLLPVGVLPETSVLAIIRGGHEEQMNVHFVSGQQEKRPLTRAAWSDLRATEKGQHKQEGVAQAVLAVNHAWLHELDAELVDAPGIEDLNQERGTRVVELLAQSDGAVLVISAVLPFSLTEAAFLAQELIGRRIAHILVVVSQLDTLPAEERSAVFQAVCRRVAKVAPHIPVLPAHSVDGVISTEEALARIRAQIEMLAQPETRRAWRSQEVAHRLADTLQRLVALAHTAETTAQMDAAQQAEAAQELRRAINATELQWSKLALDVEQHRLELEQVITQKIQQTGADMVANLTLDIERTSNPKFWWEKELPAHLRRELLTATRSLEPWLMNALVRESEWLRNTVRQLFRVGNSAGSNGQRPGAPASPFTPSHLERPNLDLGDIQRLRLVTRVLGGTATMVSVMLFLPVASIASIGSSVAIDWYIAQKIDKQRKEIVAQIDRIVELTLENYLRELQNRLRAFYAALLAEVKQEQSAWLETQLAAVAQKEPVHGKDWSMLMQEAATLRQAILTAVSQE